MPRSRILLLTLALLAIALQPFALKSLGRTAAETWLVPCKVPVFRYALEHWVPDPYRIVVLHKGELDDESASLVKKWKPTNEGRIGAANLELITIDVKSESDSAGLEEILGNGFRDSIGSPELLLLYPPESQNGMVAWRGPLTEKNIAAIAHSPARKQIADSILDGESVIWVFVPSGDPAKDDPASQLLESEIKRLENEIQMRNVDVIASEKQFGADTKVELRLGMEMRILDRSDPAEAVFLSTLINSEDYLKELGDPFAIPVFGRGRAYLALAGKGINPEMIELTSRFLIGDCSCEIKRLNPGIDLLFSVDWDERVVGLSAVDSPLPDLAGVGTYVDSSSSNGTIQPGFPADSELEKQMKESAEPKGQYWIAWALGLVLLALLAFAFSSRRSNH